MYLPPIGYLDAMKAIELRKKCVRVISDVVIVVSEDFPQEFVLGMVYRLDDVFVVAGEIEEASTFAGRAKFRQDVFAREGHEVVGGIKFEDCAQVSENPRRVVFELEVVLR